MRANRLSIRFISLMLVLTLLGATIPFVSASELSGYEDVQFVDHIVENPYARGVNKPTKSWDLTDEAYGGTFTDVQYGVYTNYYFTGVSNLQVEFYELSTDSSSVNFIFTLVDLTESSGSSEPIYVRLSSSDHADKSAGNAYSSLNPSHKYCVHMRTSGAAVSGRIVVRNHY